MPKRLSIEEVQNRADKQGKTIRVLTFSLTSEPATATCLNCGDLITCRGSTLLDKRSKTAGCENCGQKSQAKGRRRYSQESILEILENRYPGYQFTGIDENTFVKDSTKIRAKCPIHGDLGKISLRQLVDPKKGFNPCRGAGCEKRGSSPKDWAEVKAKLDAPGVLAPGVTYDASTYEKATKKMRFVCPKEGHGEFWISPKQAYTNGHGCRDCGYESVGDSKRTPTTVIRTKLTEAQGGRHSYPDLEQRHGQAGTGIETEITVVCVNGHSFPRTIESELTGAGCSYCPGSKSSQQEAEISFELGQFDKSWNPFDTQVEGVENLRLSFADIKLLNGQIIVESDPAWFHKDRQIADQKKSDALLNANPKPRAIYRIREDNPDGSPLPLITGVTTIRVRNRAKVKEIANAVLLQLVEDGFMEDSTTLQEYIESSQPTRSGDARAWYTKNKVNSGNKELDK